VLFEFECALIDAFHWSPYEIGRSNIEDLIGLAFRYPKWKRERSGGAESNTPRRVYADQAEL
jgi:hypothetical protein